MAQPTPAVRHEADPVARLDAPPTQRDHDCTDWKAVRAFADAIADGALRPSRTRTFIEWRLLVGFFVLTAAA